MKTPFFLFIIALTVRLAVIILWQFDGLYGQDPFGYFDQTLALVDHLGQGKMPPTDFFWPYGYPLLVGFFMIFLGQVPLAGQLASLLTGALLAPLTYALCRDLFPEQKAWVGILAAVIIAIAGQPILSSVVLMADMPALFWATLAAWLVVKFGKSPTQAAWLWGAGAALGMAIISRWLYALVTPALGVYVIFKIYRHKNLWWSPIGAVVSGLAILVPQVLISLNRPEGLAHAWLRGWHPLNFFLRQFETKDGFASYRLPVGVFYAQPAGHPSFLFPLLGLVALWGIWRLWRTKHWPGLILLVGWIAPVYLFLAGIPYQNLRFGLTLYLPFVILAAFGLGELWQQSTQQGKIYQWGVQSLGVVSLVGMVLWAGWSLNNFIPPQNESKALAAEIARELPPESTLLTFGLTLTLQHYTSLNTLEIFYFEPESLAALTTDESKFYLLLNVPNIETQWPGKPPYLNYYWLKEHTTLTVLNELPPYTLFVVEGEVK